jgi:hypothetical protein
MNWLVPAESKTQDRSAATKPETNFVGHRDAADSWSSGHHRIYKKGTLVDVATREAEGENQKSIYKHFRRTTEGRRYDRGRKSELEMGERKLMGNREVIYS